MQQNPSRMRLGIYFPSMLAVAVAATAVLAVPLLDNLADTRRAEMAAAESNQNCAEETARCTAWLVPVTAAGVAEEQAIRISRNWHKHPTTVQPSPPSLSLTDAEFLMAR